MSVAMLAAPWCPHSANCVQSRRAFDAALTAEWKQHQELGNPLAVLLVEIDFFTQFEDTCGSESTAECREAVAQAITETVRGPRDVVASFARGVFAVLLAETDEPQARRLADEIWLQADALVLHHPRSPVSSYVTVTVGAATCVPAAGATAADLLADAQAALAHACQHGRDQVVVLAPAGNPA